MRNFLIQQTFVQTLIPSKPISYWFDEFSKVLVVLDSEFQVSYFSFDDVFSIFKLDQSVDLVELFGKEETLLKEVSDTLQIIYKSDDSTLFIFTKSGKRIKICDKKVESINFSNAPILALELSPNQEHLVIVSQDFKIYLLNFDFDLINDCDLDDGEASDKTLDNNVCKEAAITWRGDNQYFAVLYSINGGKKCLIRDLKLKVFKSPSKADGKFVYSISEGPVTDLDNCISWQPCGSVIALFNHQTKKNFGTIQFAEKNGLRHGEFQVVTGFEDLITESTGKEIKTRVSFVQWNMDLPLLCVNQIIEFDGKRFNYLNLYFRSNYEWMLKYSIPLQGNLVGVKFSDTLSLRLFLLFESGKFQTYDFKMDYQSSLTNYNFSDDNGTIAVINGRSIKLTPLGVCNMPPPFALKTIQIPKELHPFFKCAWWKNYLFISGIGGFCVIENNLETNDYRIVYLENNRQFDHRLKYFTFCADVANKVGHLLLVKYIEDETKDELIKISYNINHNKQGLLEIKNNCNFETSKIGLCSGIFNSCLSEDLMDFNFMKKIELGTSASDAKKEVLEDKKNSNTKGGEKSLFDELMFGNLPERNEDEDDLERENSNNQENQKQVYVYLILQEDHHKEKAITQYLIHNPKGSSFGNTPSKTIPHDVIKAKSVFFGDEEHIIILSKNNRLFLDHFILAIDVTSFEVFNKFLLFTQLSNTPYHTLHIIDLTLPLPVGLNHHEAFYVPNFTTKSFNIRTIERGSLIVTLSKTSLVFQMAIRGNLETCQPRLIVLNEACRLIKSHQYIKAYEMIRKNKINLNFLYDVDPEGFFSNLSTILSQLNKVDYINLFINALVDNLCDELYQICPDIKEEFKKLHASEKTNRVCDRMREELVKINSNNKYITSILHTYTKKSPPEIFDALKLVLGLKNEEKSKIKLYTEEKMSVADQALEYICWVVNANTLYDYALKTFDFELVIMVAKHTQKDPKEYLPYLKSLQELDPILMRYQINFDLKHYDDALIELAKGQDRYFDKCMELVVKYELYERGMSLLTQEGPNADKFWLEYGGYLEKKTKTNEAGNAYLKAKCFEKALDCFQRNGNLFEVISITQRLQTPQVELEIRFKDLIDVCTSGGKAYELEKLVIYLTFNPQYATLYKCLESRLLDSMLRLKKWSSAYNIYNTTSSLLIQNEYIEGIKLAVNLISNEYVKNTNFFNEKYTRLLKLQQEKRSMPKHLLLGGEAKNWDEGLSETNSNLSNYSGKSKKSSASKLTKKNQNKIKQRKIKEGSPIEEDYLLLVIDDLKVKPEEIENLEELTRILNYSGLCEHAKQIQNMLASFQKLIHVAANVRSVSQAEFIKNHPEVKDIFPNLFDEEFIKKKGKLIEKQGPK